MLLYCGSSLGRQLAFELADRLHPLSQRRLGHFAGGLRILFGKCLAAGFDVAEAGFQVSNLALHLHQLALPLFLLAKPRVVLRRDRVVQTRIDRSDCILNGIQDAAAMAHSLKGGLIKLSDPMGFTQVARVLGIGGVVAELAFAQHEHEHGAIRLLGLRMSQCAKVGTIVQTEPQGGFDGIHVSIRSSILTRKSLIARIFH